MNIIYSTCATLISCLVSLSMSIDITRREQATTEMKLVWYAAGATQPPRHIQQDKKIRKLFERFQNGETYLNAQWDTKQDVRVAQVE